MKIKLIAIEPNPYRHIDKYPIDRAKVEALKTSIREKTFWDNILVRKHPTIKGKFQLAYGHHRHIALKELKIKEINIPCKDIEDAQMLQIMAEENLNWSTSPAIMTQTILTAKVFLENEIAKHEDLNHAGDFANVLFSSNSQYQEVKKSGVGRTILCKFLGGNWTMFKVRAALGIINDKIVDQEAVCKLPTLEQAEKFRTAVKRYGTTKP